jgi:Calcineurin-like phosphoesterase
MWLTLLKIFAGVAVYGTAVEPRFVVRNDEQAQVRNLPAAWQGKQIAVFADMQVGMMWANTDAIRRAVRRVVAIHPALVLLPGDFVYKAGISVNDQMIRVVELLQPILADSIPIYAVLGNHDYALMNEHSDEDDFVAQHVRAALSKAGVHMMDNAVRPLVAPASADATSDTLYLVGIGERCTTRIPSLGSRPAMHPLPLPRTRMECSSAFRTSPTTYGATTSATKGWVWKGGSATAANRGTRCTSRAASASASSRRAYMHFPRSRCSR